MRLMVKLFKIVGVLLLVFLGLLAAFLFWLSHRPFVPGDYTETVKTGGEIEAKYMAMGSHEVSYIEAEAPEDWKTFQAYYPADLPESGALYPVVVLVNGTGVYASKYPALFRHLASWGFIVLGNEDPSTCAGDSADATLAWLLEENEDPNSVFYQRVDRKRVGISGHSQGGVGVFNAINDQPRGGLYSCAVSLSPTEWALAAALGMEYDPYQTKIPTMILAGAENDVITPDGVKGLFDAVGSDKVAALRKDTDHGSMLYSGDGYVTAWFMYWLQNDASAGSAFWGDRPEIAGNANWENVLSGEGAR